LFLLRYTNDDVCDLIPFLKSQYPLLLASNTNELHARYFCRQFADTLRYFDHVVLSHEAGVRKPKPAFFGHCLRLAGCAPQECLFIDDLAANVAGARACGWHGIVYINTEDLKAQLSAVGAKFYGCAQTSRPGNLGSNPG
jgi:putative hydrolase of the HAD superfamily